MMCILIRWVDPCFVWSYIYSHPLKKHCCPLLLSPRGQPLLFPTNSTQIFLSRWLSFLKRSVIQIRKNAVFHQKNTTYQGITTPHPLLRNKKLMLDEMTQRNASKFAIFYTNENPKLVFPFFISCYFIFSPNECPGLCRHRLGHSLGKNIK